MTFNLLMPPALPLTSAASLKTFGDPEPAALKSSRLNQSTKDSRSFLDTLNQVSLCHKSSPHESTCAKIRTEVSADSAEQPLNNGKIGNSGNDSPNLAVETGAAAAARTSPIFDLPQAFGMIQMRSFSFSMADNGSFLSATPSELPDASGSGFLPNLMGYVQQEGQGSLMEWLLGIGPFEQLQANISPEAGNRYLLEQLAAEFTINQGSEGMAGAQTEFIGFWNWRASAPEFTLNNPAESLWVNGETLLAALLQMQQPVAAASGLNADAIGTAAQNVSADLETIQLKEALSAKMTISSFLGESGLFENTKLAADANMAAAEKNAPVTSWATADLNSQTFLEKPSRQITENSPFFKMTADIKAVAEQAVNPNFVSEGVPGKPTDDGFGLKNPVLKAESLPIVELGSKTAQIEGDAKDGGFLFAQDQMPGHLKTLESAMRSSESAQRGLASQAMDQIVQKAILLLNNDQHEVRIELRPEFLGQIRMQIVTENQQVAIRIAAEFPFVKDMLENNLHQLKAALQVQGLDIEELEVSVAHDSHAEGDPHQTAEVAKVQAVRNETDFDDGASEEPGQSQSLGSGATAETVIDFFA